MPITSEAVCKSEGRFLCTLVSTIETSAADVGVGRVTHHKA